MRLLRIAVLVTAGMLAACGDEPPAARNNTEAPLAAPAAQPSPAGSNLTGSVSGLTGAVTGFLVRETPTATIVEMAADTLFAFDSADLSPQAQETLLRLIPLVRAGGEGEIVVAGHTDGLGSDAYNIDLSRRRAEAVRDWLVAREAAPALRFRIEAAGKSRPRAPNTRADGSDDPQGRARNRRVEVVIPRA